MPKSKKQRKKYTKPTRKTTKKKTTQPTTGIPGKTDVISFDATKQEKITTTNWKAKGIVDEFLKKYRTWELPFGIFIAMVIALLTSDFKEYVITDTITLTSSDTQTIFLVLFGIDAIITIICFSFSRKFDSKYLIEEIRDKGASFD